MNVCLQCGKSELIEIARFPGQPISNRYPLKADEKEFTHPIVVRQCSDCTLIQLSDPVPAAELKPRVTWINYVEPEGHLDGLAEILSRLPGLSKQASILGLSFKDDSLL